MANFKNMNPTSIDWPGLTHTLNPVSGCLRGCSKATKGFDCYAQKLHDKRHRAYLAGKKVPRRYAYPFNEIHYHHETFGTVPKNPRKPTKIFIGSMSDICYWDFYAMWDTIDFMESRPGIEFMLLTKDCKVYKNYVFPFNCWLGLTITSDDDYKQFNKFENVDAGNKKFLSIEPLLGTVNLDMSCEVKQIIVGADTSKDPVIPQQRWINSIVENAKHTPIHYKKNILEYMEGGQTNNYSKKTYEAYGD